MSKSAKDVSWQGPEWFTPEDVDTVIVAFPGVYGRLLGKRMTYEYFVNHVLEHGTHVCNYLLATDIHMNCLPGFELASWEKGYGDFHVVPDMRTLRRLPWHEKTAVVLSDLHHDDDRPVEESPRRVLGRQIERLTKKSQKACIGSELEFALFTEDYDALGRNGFSSLTATSDHAVDYHILQPARDEDVLRRIRNEMSAAGIEVECSKGECGKGQHEVNLMYSEAMEMADRHILYKIGAKDIANQQGKALTFMAKWDEAEAGNGFHLHISLWDAEDGENLFWDSKSGAPSDTFRQFLGGLLKYSRELTYFVAPTVNSYKRFQPDSWAPTAIVCGRDNRTCGLRVVGSGNSLRIENRMPGADANSYLTFAATLVAGLQGIEEKLDGEIYSGNAYADSTLQRLPESLEQATELLAGSEIARTALGSDVVDFYTHTAALEAKAFHKAVTDWERRRYFEQL